MKKILIIEDENIANKILEEFSEEISIVKNINKQTKLKYKNLVLDVENYELLNNGKKVELTIKEFEILKLLMESPNKVFTRDNLLNSIWNYDYFGDEKIVNTHIKNIRKKLGNDIIETVRGVGYKMK